MSLRPSSPVAVVLLLALGIGAAAAAPTAEQQSAIRSACQSDYRAHCASVPPGGAAALQCLQQNLASLSPACQNAVNAASGAATQGAPAQTPPAQATTTQPTTTQSTSGSGQPTGDQATSGQPAATQPPPQPTEAQLTALRSACPRDYGTYCGNVPAGGAAALQCLQQNAASLSPNCKAAVEAISPPPPAKPTEAQLTAIRAACPRDYGTYCGDVPAGGAPALQCLQKNVASLSPSCKSAVEAVGGGAAPAAATTAAPAAPAQPTQAQQTAIKSACQHDYRAHCASVPPGGAAALQCLQKNAASLSPSCQKAVAAVGGGAATGMATTTTTAPATVPAAVPPAQQPVIVMSPREEMMVMRQACGPDYQAYCPGVRIMGGAALQCLMANSGRLSGGCKSALAQFERRQ